MMVEAPAAPGVTLAGMKETVACEGAPDSVIVTRLLNAPPSGGTLTVTCTDPPGRTVYGICAALTLKAGFTVSVNGAEFADANPELPE